MADETRDTSTASGEQAPGDDPRKEWVEPTISDLAVSETRGQQAQAFGEAQGYS